MSAVRTSTASVAAIGHVNCLVLIVAVSAMWSLPVVAARFDPNAVAFHAVDTMASQALRKQANQCLFHVVSSWLFGAAAPSMPWQLELEPLWHTLR